MKRLNGLERLISMLNYFLKGIFMGFADTIPGVSGGTVAFITGIYAKLVFQIKAIVDLFKQSKGHPLTFVNLIAKHLDWLFLIPLIAGIISGALLMARVISFLLDHYFDQVWMFFCGLIISSSVLIARKPVVALKIKIGLIFAGFVAGYLVSNHFKLSLGIGWHELFLGGALASMAMILPGISGSAILISTGQYEHVLELVRKVTEGILQGEEVILLICFICGVLTGLFVMGYLLGWFFQRYSNWMILFFSGFLVGVLPGVFPWLNAYGLALPEDTVVVSQGILSLTAGLLIPLLFEILSHTHGEHNV